MYRIESFKLARTTKNALVYEEVDANGNPKHYNDPTRIIGTLYVNKLALGREAPIIQVSVGDEQK